MSIAKPAATVMVLRQGAKEPELILLKRSRKVGFFPSAWVFPGGRVDDLDSEFPSIGDAHDGVGGSRREHGECEKSGVSIISLHLRPCCTLTTIATTLGIGFWERDEATSRCLWPSFCPTSDRS